MMTPILIILGIIAAAFILTVLFGAPYVPSLPKQIDQTFSKLYPLSKNDVLIDIGSGDGIVLRYASRMGAKKAIGYEINPFLVMISWYFSRGHTNVTTKLANFWSIDFPDDVTVCYVFAESRDIEKVARKIQQQANRIGRPIHLISHAFKTKQAKLIRTEGAHYLYLFEPKI